MTEDCRECWILSEARCTVPKTMGCASIDCPVLMSAARGDYGPSLKFLARYGRIRYIAGGNKELERTRLLDKRQLHDSRMPELQEAGAGYEAGLLPGMPDQGVKYKEHTGAGAPDGIMAEEKAKAEEA